MALLETPEAEMGAQAHDFALPATDGSTVTLADAAGENGLLVMFICNHCPYVQRQLTELTNAARELQAAGVGVVAISANDIADYPEDSPEHMTKLAEARGFSFPYLYDESQSVAKAYGAVCTPDFFGYNAELKLQFRGRLTGPSGEPELVDTMKEIAKKGSSGAAQHPSMGCSIKWKSAAA